MKNSITAFRQDHDIPTSSLWIKPLLSSALDHRKEPSEDCYIRLVDVSGEDVEIPETADYEEFGQNMRQQIRADDLVALLAFVA